MLKTKEHLHLVMGSERDDPWRCCPTRTAAAMSSLHPTVAMHPPNHATARPQV